MRWTNDVYVSTPHRVVNRGGRERYSVAFFLDPNPDAEVACLPTCVSAERPARYPPISGADYLRERLDCDLWFPPTRYTAMKRRDAMAKPTKANTIHQAIADDIVHGRLAPGTALDETSIAAAFGVSRTPIREAIRQLEAIGLVEGAGAARRRGRQPVRPRSSTRCSR